MALIQCTQKLLQELPYWEKHSPVTARIGNNWHANILLIERRKCVIFTHDQTLYTFLVPKLLKADFQKLDTVFLQHATLNLAYEGLAVQQQIIIDDCNKELRFVPSSNRSVMSSMNELVRCMRYYLNEGLDNINCLALNAQINRIPMKAVNRKYAIDYMEVFGD